jgi:hypothetical protein
MGYQFLHLEAYSLQPRKRKGEQSRSIADVLAEAGRDPSHSQHIEKIKPPKYLFGEPLSAILAGLTRDAENARDRTGKKKLPRDAKILLAGIASAPIPTEILLEDMKRFEASKDKNGRGDPELITSYMLEYDIWRKKTMEFLAKRFGDSLRTVVMHYDEPHIHIHFYCRNELKNGTLNLDGLHDGMDAERALALGRAARNEKKGAGPKMRWAAYCNAMRGLQDYYWATVGAFCAQARLGPRKRRLKNKEYKTEQIQLVEVARQLRDAEQRVREAEAEVNKAKFAKAFAKQTFKAKASFDELSAEISVLSNELQALTAKPEPVKLARLASKLKDASARLERARATIT